MTPGNDDTRALVALQQLKREMIEQRYVRRADGLERVGEAVRRLGEVGSPAGLIARSAEELGVSSSFDDVLVSRVERAELAPLAAWSSDGAAHQPGGPSGRPLALGYPLIDHDVSQRQEGAIVDVAHSGPRAQPLLARERGWHSYVVAAIVLEVKTVGMLHAHRAGDPPLDELDLRVASLYAEGLGHAFERAVLRDKLARQRGELRSAAQWINGRLLDDAGDDAPRAGHQAAGEISEILTPRELEVLGLITRGLSNRAIASTLVLREGTVKYHVKNILRKLQASSRAEAVSRYMQLSGAAEVRA